MDVARQIDRELHFRRRARSIGRWRRFDDCHRAG